MAFFFKFSGLERCVISLSGEDGSTGMEGMLLRKALLLRSTIDEPTSGFRKSTLKLRVSKNSVYN